MPSNKKVEILQNIELNDAAIIGKSISTLARFATEKLPVSSGFVISKLGFSYFLNFSDIKKYYENSKKFDAQNLEKAFDVVELPDLLKEEVSKCYSKISGFTDAYVNLRALIIDNDGNEIKHRAFVELDIRGEKNILNGIKELYKSIILDDEKIISKYFSGGLFIVLLIQKAQQSEASGVMFTTDIITNDQNKLIIEAVYGLESIAEMESVVPDQYIYDKTKHEILEKHITTQEFMAVRQPSRDANNIQKVKISPAWQKRQKLDDKHIITLAKTGLIIEEGLEEPQQILWSFESGKIWINFIESSNKITLETKEQPNLQQLVDEQFINSLANDEKINTGIDLNVHIPEEISSDKDILMDLVLSENEEKQNGSPTPQIQIETPAEVEISTNVPEIQSTEEETATKTKLDKKEQTKMDTQDKNQNLHTNSEPLLEGKYFAGSQAQGEICLVPENCKKNSILVLKGDENLPSNIKVAGFIIEDDSEVLAHRLSEYFDVPTITGVPLARKILKPSELIKIDGSTGYIYETVPFSEQVGEIEMNFVATTPSTQKDSHISIPVKDDEDIHVHTQIHSEQHKDTHDENVLESAQEILEDTFPKSDDTKDLVIDYKLENEVAHINTTREEPKVIKQTVTAKVEANLKDLDIEQTKDISRFLGLVEEDPQIVEVLSEDEDTDKPVEGLNEKDQFNIWGKSLEKIISATKEIPSSVAIESLEHIIDDSRELTENSKEFSFDEDAEYIADKIHKAEEHKKFDYPYLPTATKVYVNLVDEKLPSLFKNYDGIIFSSSFDQELYLELLEDVLENSDGKEVIAICPPYELAALERFLKSIYDLRNSGHRQLSLILPDYRNKKEISEVKKLLSITGLKRSSTFTIFANLSRAINVFRVAELNKTLVDGIFIDLFRLKMNMLGVERQTASTKYVEGMKNLVSYLNENLADNDKSIINITGFENPQKVLDHVLSFKFWAVACSLPQANDVKKEISNIEKKHITLGNNSNKKGRLKRRK